MNQNNELVSRMTDLAHALLESMSTEQRTVARWDFPSNDERLRWFYTPTDHGGLTLHDMHPAQQRLTMQLLASGLSRAGFVTAATIMGLENILDELEGWAVGYGHDRGRDPARYYLRIFGTPGEENWSWRFGGHHISVHHTIINGELRAFTPCFCVPLRHVSSAPTPTNRHFWARIPYDLSQRAPTSLSNCCTRSMSDNGARPSCLQPRRSIWLAPTALYSAKVTRRCD
jgi:hypothetical protein